MLADQHANLSSSPLSVKGAHAAGAKKKKSKQSDKKDKKPPTFKSCHHRRRPGRAAWPSTGSAAALAPAPPFAWTIGPSLQKTLAGHSSTWTIHVDPFVAYAKPSAGAVPAERDRRGVSKSHGLSLSFVRNCPKPLSRYLGQCPSGGEQSEARATNMVPWRTIQASRIHGKIRLRQAHPDASKASEPPGSGICALSLLSPVRAFRINVCMGYSAASSVTSGNDAARAGSKDDLMPQSVQTHSACVALPQRLQGCAKGSMASKAAPNVMCACVKPQAQRLIGTLCLLVTPICPQPSPKRGESRASLADRRYAALLLEHRHSNSLSTACCYPTFREQ
ncbi:hypothetical protein CDD81_1656 [Ophiocordyceps australis]|uniref:Uncharacterized protein n=1 Tax=Ophiocordyceps australis TaxID=1399860 RepID=A0A2C5Y0E3_9HYPO|nr:hypothetical protein CDD81_1656 [Ophiocordyceps australis]